MPKITLINGDCASVDIPANAAIVSDPPYGSSTDTDYTRFTGGMHEQRNNFAPITGDDTPFDPARWITHPYVALFGYQFFADQLPVGTILVWNKKRSSQLGTFLSDAELAWMKGGKGVYLFHHVWNGFDRETERGKTLHPTQKPVVLMRWVINRMKLPTGTLIVDPYMGSGSTGIAAKQLGYDFMGIELDPTYYAIAEERIHQAEEHSLDALQSALDEADRLLLALDKPKTRRKAKTRQSP